jgi:hypothetical protein
VINGSIVMESLRVGARLDRPNFTVREIYRFRPVEIAPGQADTWTVLQFEAEEDSAADLAESFAQVLSDTSWYADFRSPTETFVVFADRIFRYPRGSKTGREEARTYARTVGIAEPHLDWPG